MIAAMRTLSFLVVTLLTIVGQISAVCAQNLPLTQANGQAVGQIDAPVAAIAPQFMPIFPLGADGSMAAQLLPLISNLPLGVPQPGVKRAVIAIHDLLRDAPGTQARIMTFAGKTADPQDQQAAQTLVLTPQFLLAGDVAAYASYLPDQGKAIAVWQPFGWMVGDDSDAPSPPRAISSFAALDIILAYLATREYFPNLQQVVITGYGDGAVFTQLYAAAGAAPEILATAGIDVRFVVVQAPYYLYLTAARPQEKQAGFKTPDSNLCPGYQFYPFGLERPVNYVRQQGVSNLRLRYPTRAVHYVVSGLSPSRQQVPDQSCGALLQGYDWRARASNYQAYLQATYGGLADKLHHLHVLGSAASANALYGSPCGHALLFGDGECTVTIPDTIPDTMPETATVPGVVPTSPPVPSPMLPTTAKNSE